ncbi:oligopeptide/dipeptide ABC transporter, ATP-binding protein [Halobacteroides halobius DSM 5150]|uniref:Oligopeptide/dipeptide ABC transporter, ATP-binding protein n=1 Tax=Halobacteroides halobius (strain ATCC 35273 / DSM 5150 / MD-1) TaxID=748449 RepID=L0K591_HALHC|nr:dipeptide ABC transporter ATP-binding protein [Halobacteroides halobius]AGB40432.1 oligopeptide/dipeptide ABC transporter, ATP-binding protein [Halobacteroides halobius DSM 5150]
MKDAILEVKNLKKHFPIKGGIFKRQINSVKAVDGLNFEVKRGETLGLVGESGCGKSTTGKVLLRLLEATEGEVVFEGQNIYDLDKKEMRSLRREMQMIFQDPYASLNPRMTVGEIIGEPLEIHGLASGQEKEKRVRELLDKVGLQPNYANRYPHEFSGGQRQRIGIARALAVNPKIIVCDEPVSALDVSIQAQVINLLEELQEELGLTYIFIAHDLSVVRHISDRVAVMYLGEMAELADKDELYENPKHPYTKALLSAIPVPNPEANKDRILLEGDVPSPINPPSGCSFHTRCPFAKEICKKKTPQFKDTGDGHFYACHLVE